VRISSSRRIDSPGSAAFAVRGQSVERCATDEHGIRTKRQCLCDVGAAPDTAVVERRDTPCYDIHDFVEHVDWGNCRIEVPPSVIGNDDPVQSVPYRELGIRGDAVWLKLVNNLASGPLSILALSTARQVYESAPCLDAARRSRRSGGHCTEDGLRCGEG
jgi:hypothetical protein